MLALGGKNLSGLAEEPKDLDRRTMSNEKENKKKMTVEMVKVELVRGEC